MGKRGKLRDGTDPETPSCCAPIPTETTTVATRGKLFDVQKLLNKTGMEFYWPCYQYMDPAPI